MAVDISRSASGFQWLETWGVLLLLLASPAQARPHETYAERPGLREESVRQARERADREKAEVRTWAAYRGLPVRFEDGTRVAEIMALRNGRPLIYITNNDKAAISTAAGDVRNTPPFQADGAGVSVGIWDGGSVMTNHQEFGTRVIAIDGGSAYYHATHVGGTIGASGVVARSEGMAPQAHIDSYDWDADDAEMAASAASFPGEAGKIQLSNHSYGILAGWFYAGFINPWTRRSGYHWWGDITSVSADPYFGQYGYGAREWDRVVYDAPYFLPFKAAGNERDDGPTEGATVYYTADNGETWQNTVYNSALHPLADGVYKGGYDTVPYLGNAKNILTVGALTDAVTDGLRDPSAASITAFTSWGPADDGRIKPDIVANGFEVYSCNTTATNSYAVRSGTSMATPNACGSAALLVDYFDNLFPGQAMRASTLKGLIIHSADDLGRPGPDYQFGWGLMNTRKAADLLTAYAAGNPISLTEAMLDPTNTVHTYAGYADGGEPLRVTLCWTDPPGAYSTNHDDRTAALVNDLDLRLEGPGGISLPFTLDVEQPEAAAATDVPNRVDNVEQVLVAVPVPGHYTITVDYEGALQDGRQWYSLLVSGMVSDSDGDGLPDLWESGFFQDSTNALAEADADGDGMDNLSEYIAGSDPTDPNSVFGFTSVESISATGHPPFVINWHGVPGRIYNVHWTYNLQYVPLSNISGALHSPANSYTDSVDRIGNASYYRLDVRMDQ